MEKKFRLSGMGIQRQEVYLNLEPINKGKYSIDWGYSSERTKNLARLVLESIGEDTTNENINLFNYLIVAQLNASKFDVMIDWHGLKNATKSSEHKHVYDFISFNVSSNEDLSRAVYISQWLDLPNVVLGNQVFKGGRIVNNYLRLSKDEKELLNEYLTNNPMIGYCVGGMVRKTTSIEFKNNTLTVLDGFAKEAVWKSIQPFVEIDDSENIPTI